MGVAHLAAATVLLFGRSLISALPGLLATAAAFTLLGLVARARRGTPHWWRKPDLLTDLLYAGLLPGLATIGRTVLLVVGLVVFRRMSDPAAIAAFMAHGSGPLAALPFAAQVVVYLLLSDLVLYATHRAFHGRSLWRFHAVHHSSEQVEWTSNYRWHPVDVLGHTLMADAVCLLMGISPDVVVLLIPFNVGISALVHADLDWDFGPLRTVLVSPVYHRWHHTSPRQGGNKNFAATFPVFDLMFGTYYMPRGSRPERFGCGDRTMPGDLVGQVIHPFRRRPDRNAPSGITRAGGSRTTRHRASSAPDAG